MMPRPQVSLPPLYYVDHFHEMIDFVAATCAGLLGEDERAFIRDFRALDAWAQRLYVRMVNRRKTAFRPADLAYREIGDLRGGLAALTRAGFVRPLDARDHRAALADMNKPDLLTLAKTHAVAARASWSKP